MADYPSGMMAQRNTRSGRPAGSRPTIGLLIGRLDEQYQAAVWSGVADLAAEQDVNLLCFAGESLRSPYGFEAYGNVLYDLVSPQTVDGLVILSGSIGHFLDPEELRQFCERYRPLPMVNIALAVEGIPAVLVDNDRGVREAITHLVEVHGYRRIAFIRGPAGHPEAEARYRAYGDSLAGYGLPLDPSLVVAGDFTTEAGTEAIRLLIDERKVEWEAAVAADDAIALGALGALQARGIRVPYDVAVVGFDDTEDARFATPPLTTVRQPLYEQGWQASEMVLAPIGGEAVPPQVVLPTELVVRQSCGCFSEATLQVTAGQVTDAAPAPAAFPSEHREAMLAEMAEAVRDPLLDHARALDPGWADRLLNGFTAEMKGDVRGVFLPVLDEILRRVASAGGDINLWQGALSVLRRHVLPSLTSKESAARCEDLWHQARVLIGETAQRAQAQQRLQAEQQAQRLREISQALITTADVEQLIDLVAQEVPRLGIRRCYLSLYEGKEAPPPQSRLILAYDERGRSELPAGGQLFPSRQLLPSGMLPLEQRYSIAVEPLHFRDDQIGFSLIDMGPRDGNVYATLRGQLSSALKGALLFREREQLLADNARAVGEMRRLNQDLQQTLDTQEQLLETIRALSTPVMPLLKRVILLPLVGHIDTERARQIMDQLLTGIQEHRARIAIVDITGVPIVDTSVANSLLQAAQAARLLGAEVVLAGIRPDVAQTIVGLGVDLSGIATENNLQSGVEYALRRLSSGLAT